MENDVKTEDNLIKQNKTKKNERRNFLGKIIGGGTAIILSSTILSKKVYAKKAVSEKKMETKKKLMKVSGETPLNYGQNLPKSDAGQATGPLKNHRWMSWLNPAAWVKDGWVRWYVMEPYLKLPIWHEQFYEIKESHPKHHWAMVMDLRKCVGCQSCVVACKSENNVPVGVFRTVVDVMDTGHMEQDPKGIVITDEGNFSPNVKKIMLPRICNHCDHPPCVEVCPVKATFKRQDGLVLINFCECIGCGTCIQSCPYNMRFFNPVMHTADKCTFCVHRLDQGLEPACVMSCVGRARVFGDRLDPKSEVSKLLASFPTSRLLFEMGTIPQIFYIDLDGNLTEATNPKKVNMAYTYSMDFLGTAYEKLGGKVNLPYVEETDKPYSNKI
ncbi:MAG: 4Fe-4S dicluster domain-containing protein [bacterium]